MTAQEETSRLAPKRLELAALAGTALQGAAVVAAALLAAGTSSRAMGLLTLQAAVGVLLWLLSYLHLRLRRRARDEAFDLALAERQRRTQGLESLFEDKEEGESARNLRQMERYLAPMASVAAALLLAAPVIWWAFRGKTPWRALAETGTLDTANALMAAIISACVAFVCFLLGMYAAGLAREKDARPLRAGGGYLLSTALFFLLAGVALGMSGREWGQRWPDALVAGIIVVWTSLQAVEIIVNLILNIYRPRVAGAEPRPAYDSRLSGLLAEPSGLFKTFAHTLDYQFGFKVSETWFFHFLERAFAPLLLIQLLTFYLLTSLVVVRPGEAVIIERWGAPFGRSLPAADDEAGWEALPKPLGPGFYLKYPWPIDKARVVPVDRLRIVYAGFESAAGDMALEKVLASAEKPVSWDGEHLDDELHYLMPLPQEMTVAGIDQDLAARAGVEARARDDVATDTLFVSGIFALHYRVGKAPGDLMRFHYRYADPDKVLQAHFEREVTAYLAGARFWDILGERPGEAATSIRAALAADARRMGVDLVDVLVESAHPPAGEVGKAYQNVLAARQDQQAAIFKGEGDRYEIEAAAKARVATKMSEARAYKRDRVVVAKAEAERFGAQLAAWRAAPKVYLDRLRYLAIADTLSKARLVVHPPGVEIRIDNTREMTGAEMEVLNTIRGEAEKQRR